MRNVKKQKKIPDLTRGGKLQRHSTPIDYLSFYGTIYKFNHIADDLGIGHTFDISGLPSRISTKPSLLEIGIQTFDNMATLLLMLDQAFGFVK